MRYSDDPESHMPTGAIPQSGPGSAPSRKHSANLIKEHDIDGFSFQPTEDHNHKAKPDQAKTEAKSGINKANEDKLNGADSNNKAGGDGKKSDSDSINKAN